MKVLQISAENYRNLEVIKQEFCDGINYIYGENAQGKTNLIESIWMLTGARSFRGTKDCDLIKFGRDFAEIKSKVFMEDRKQEIRLIFSDGKRKAFLNDVPQKYPTEIIGKFRAVLFSPIHLTLICGGPEKRRKFVDAAICQLKPTYTALLIRYNQTLRQRNSFLKKCGESYDAVFLDVLDSKLSELGAEIVRNRLIYADWLRSEAIAIYSEISQKKEEFDIRYISKIAKSSEISRAETENIMREKLQKNRASDMKIGFTSVGPHKDDVEIYINQKAVRNFGSQGQQRSAVLALKLAEAEILNKRLNDSPIILLDDVMSELDDARKSYMIQKTKNWQVFITGCDKYAVDMMTSGKAYELENGKIQSVKTF